MGAHYWVKLETPETGYPLLRVGFGETAENNVLVREAAADIEELGLGGGPGLKVNGPASLPVAMTIAHAVAHLYGFVACFDPKLGKYVVAITHTPDRGLGDILD